MRWHTGDPIFDTVLAVALATVPITVLALRFMKAPYGRFADGAKLAVNPRLGWFLMELPAMVVFWIFFLAGPRRTETVPMVLAGLWTLHYLNRGFFFPLSIRAPKGSKGTFGMLVLVSGWFVTSAHGYMNGTFFSRLAPHFTEGWLTDPRFLVGIAVYAVGFVLNVHSDAVVRNLRTKEEIERAEKVYRVPRGGGFELVSNPAYLGELIMWTGFALFTWSLPGVFILGITAANLVPRALDNHRWYRERFSDYPRDRKALVPYLL